MTTRDDRCVSRSSLRWTVRTTNSSRLAERLFSSHPARPSRSSQVAAARLDALENDNAEAEGGGDDDSEYEIEDGEGTSTRP